MLLQAVLDTFHSGIHIFNAIRDQNGAIIDFQFILLGKESIAFRGRQDLPAVGIFAQRARNRPNRLGVSVCELVGVDGRNVHVRGLDAIDGTPVLDLKPVLTAMRPPGEVTEPAWVDEIMQHYW